MFYIKVYLRRTEGRSKRRLGGGGRVVPGWVRKARVGRLRASDGGVGGWARFLTVLLSRQKKARTMAGSLGVAWWV